MYAPSWSRLALVFPFVVTVAGTYPRAGRADPEDLLGTYRLQGRFRLDARPFPAREDALHADAIVVSAAGGEVRMRLAGEGITCELAATRDGNGELGVAAGQRCRLALASNEGEARAEARVVSGSGRLRDDSLHLELKLSVNGSLRPRSALGSLGRVLSLPGSRAIPFEGEAWGRAAGKRDRSRAGE
jgi:hypothetical protein